MLDRAHRFHGLNSLTYAYRRGQTVRGPQLALKYALNQRRQTYRVAVVVSRKVDKSAVVRNRIRRRIYAVVHELSEAVTLPYDLVFTVFSAQVADIEHKQLSRLVRDQLRRARVIQSPSGQHAIVNSKE